MPPSKINIDRLTRYFEENADRVFAPGDLELLFISHPHDWNLPRSMRPDTFLKMLLRRTNLRPLEIRSQEHRSIKRYVWGTDSVSPLSVAISIMKDDAFFSHRYAMWIHGLGENHKDIFINKEQSEKPRSSGQLSQQAIDNAFRNEQRRSKLTYTYHDTRITLLSGKHTGRLAVERTTAPTGHEVEVTSLERTLIDITVRPAYSGGVSAVLQAFGLARQRTSVAAIIRLLKKLDYTYPYHQSIGFYLKYAGYSESDQLLAREMGTKFNFYLCHGLTDAAFDPEWRIFFPRTLAPDVRGQQN